jgi:predicted transcriptional regulator
MTDPRSGDRHAETPLTVRFSDDRRRLEDFAAATHTPVRRVVRDAVRAWLDKHTAGNGETGDQES